VLVDGKRKIGAFSLAFKDLALPLAGLPIEIMRSYDSRDRMRAGDFGYGWTLGVNAVTLRKNRPLGEDWYQSIQEFSVMGAEMYLYSLEPDVAPGGTTPVKHLVTISFPDDTMATFEMGVEAIGGGVGFLGIRPEAHQKLVTPITQSRVVFKPANNRTKGKLELADGSLAWTPGIQETGDGPMPLREDYDSSSAVFNPTRFRYTADDGTVYIIDEKLGLVSMTDPAGTELAIERDEASGRVIQISHSSGQAVLVHRDPQGRIESVEDLYGAFIEYLYNEEGDLTGVVDRTGEVTT
jgi:hypothetical protein